MIADQNRMFNDAISTNSRMLDEAIKQFSENNSKMLNEAIREYSKNNAQMINDAVRQQKELFDEMIRQQGQFFSNSMKTFNVNNTKLLRDGANSTASDVRKFKKKRTRA